MAKKRIMAMLMAVTMVLSMIPVLSSQAEEAVDNAIGAVVAPVTGENYRNLGLTPGATVEEMRFTWHSGSRTGSIIITDPANPSFRRELPSTGRPLEAHQGTEPMGADTDMFPGRPGYIYYVHQVAVYDLNPETLYNYVVTWAGGSSATKSFRTGGGDAFAFLIAGDPQIGVGNQSLALDGEGWIDTLDVAVSAYPHAEFVLSVGDQIHTTAGNVEVAQARHDWMFGASHLASLPLMPVVGNHDGSGLGNTNSRLWPMHYNIPDTSENVLRFNNQFYTQFDFWSRWGNALIIQLDSNTTTWVNSVGGQGRLEFMEDAIATNSDADWIIVTFHHPPYSVYRASNDTTKIQIIQNWIPEFERLGVDVVLGGHCHVYSRTHQMISNVPQPDQQWLNAAGQIRQDETGMQYQAVLDPTGIVYFAFNSASGSGYYNVTQMPRNYIAAYNQNFRRNFSAVNVTPHTLEIATYQVNNDGSHTLMDVYTIVRSVDGAVPEGYTFRQLGADVMQRITDPAPSVGNLHGVEATPEGLRLPETVGVETDLLNNDGGNTVTIRNPGGQYGRNVRSQRAVVTWDVEGSDFDPAYTGEQNFTVYGVVEALPATIINPNNVSLEVSIEVHVFAYGDGPPPIPPTIPVYDANQADYGTPVMVAGYVTAVLRNDRIKIQDSTSPWGGIFVTANEPVDHYLGQWVIVEGTRSYQWAQNSIGGATVIAHPDTTLVPLTPVLLPLGVFGNEDFSEWNSMLVSFYAELTALDPEGFVHNISGDGVSITLQADLSDSGLQTGDMIRVDRAIVHWRADLEAERMHTDWYIGGVVRAADEPLTVAEANMRTTDDEVIVRGIVVNYYDTSPGNRNALHLQDYDSRTPLSGILVRGPLGFATDEIVGSEIIVVGVRNGDQVGSGFGEIENITITGPEAITIIDPNPPQPTPVVIDNLLQLRGGAYRSMLISIEGIQLTTDLLFGGPGGDRPNYLLYRPYGSGDYHFVVACGIDGWHLMAGIYEGADIDGGSYLTIHRAAVHWWQARNEVQIRLIDPTTDVELFVPEA
ncbi:MAG: metallophosphoesterase family protein [Defluviitaleaceae bacterium]|nr:metallophosphoesterase family protein [Defluviitaleaceae bacterium]